ncbi:MAG: methylenetetrahydrofolate reductase [NAD(P)H] [Arenicellales bacterium]
MPKPPDSDLAVSFEFFPPGTDRMEQTLWSSIERLAALGPRFVSVTYGAGGSTRERTHATVRRVLEETPLEAAAHLTCVAATRADVDAVARAYWQAGVRHIVALRGDPVGGEGLFQPHPDGYESAAALVAGLKRVAPFELSVAAYPEVHPDACSPRADLDNLKRKIDAGATRAITQFFFDNDVYYRFLDRVRGAGIDVPVVPGILPVTGLDGLLRFAARCGAAVPRWIRELFDGLDADPETRRLVAATVAAEQCAKLRARGVREFHFYTLNRAELTYAVCHMLGMRPAGWRPSEETGDWRAQA